MARREFNFFITGDDEIIDKLEQLGQAANDVAYRAAQTGAEIIKGEIERTAPRRTGKLAAGFEIRRGRIKENGANAVITVRDRDLEYAFYLEFGVPHRRRGGALPKQPFIRPAFDARQEEANGAAIRELKEALGL